MMNEMLNISGALLVKLFGRESDEERRFRDRAAGVRDIGVRRAVLGTSLFALLGIIVTLSVSTMLSARPHALLERGEGARRNLPQARRSLADIAEHAAANGVAFSPEGNVLWVSETCRNTLLNLELLEDGVTINPIAGATIPYRFTGGPGGCDSMAVDVEGNVYQCLIFQGRALILNKRGIPIANVLIPGRDEGKNLGTTKLAFKPGTNEVFIMAWGKAGAWIYKFRGLAQGLKLFSHQ